MESNTNKIRLYTVHTKCILLLPTIHVTYKVSGEETLGDFIISLSCGQEPWSLSRLGLTEFPRLVLSWPWLGLEIKTLYSYICCHCMANIVIKLGRGKLFSMSSKMAGPANH